MPHELVFEPEAAAADSAFTVLGVRVDAVQIPDAIAQMEHWIAEWSVGHFVAFTGMHGVTEARRDPAFMQVLDAADLVVPDGMPLVWLGRWHGYKMRRRVYGPELLKTFCVNTGPIYRHYFYGGAPGVAETLARRLRRFYDVRTVGTYSPPYRPLTSEEKLAMEHRIRAAAPDIVWVGLSTPKQERWMFEERARLGVPVLAGVGAAFDFLAGTARQAPDWMREHGLEWLFRVANEPRRLWRRYAILGSDFAWNVALELLGVKKFSSYQENPRTEHPQQNARRAA
jgi:N-acetylglucosaminyldiphosphoundecaprenol N-acetyl-beta-D-mannosaminyltransferase